MAVGRLLGSYSTYLATNRRSSEAEALFLQQPGLALPNLASFFLPLHSIRETFKDGSVTIETVPMKLGIVVFAVLWAIPTFGLIVALTADAVSLLNRVSVVALMFTFAGVLTVLTNRISYYVHAARARIAKNAFGILTSHPPDR